MHPPTCTYQRIQRFNFFLIVCTLAFASTLKKSLHPPTCPTSFSPNHHQFCIALTCQSTKQKPSSPSTHAPYQRIQRFNFSLIFHTPGLASALKRSLHPSKLINMAIKNGRGRPGEKEPFFSALAKKQDSKTIISYRIK